jgi:uncharacterized membrane protein YphA (DoxX/SURF4 family)
LSGIDKLLHRSGFETALQDYFFVPDGSVAYLALLVPLFELWIAIGLVVVRWRKPSALAASLLLMVFAIALGVNRLSRPTAPCGCWFTFTLGQATMPHVAGDFMLAALAFTLWLEPRRSFIV